MKGLDVEGDVGVVQLDWILCRWIEMSGMEVLLAKADTNIKK